MIEKPDVQWLLDRVGEIYNPATGLEDAVLEDLSVLEFQALGVWLGLRGRDATKPIDDLTRDALTLLVTLGADTNYDFDIGAERIVIIGSETVWKLALNTRGDVTSNVEAAAALSAPIAPARWTYVAGIRTLEMERVEIVTPDDLADEELQDNPWWTDVDGWKLGRRRTGELVVFDAGLFGPNHRVHLPYRYRARIRPED